MSPPSLATHMVSLPDGKQGNNALGYCTSTSVNPDVSTTLRPLGSAWSKWVLKGTNVIVKWLNVPGQPEFLHVLDGETSTSSRLPRRLLQRSAADVVTVRTLHPRYFSADVALEYGTASPYTGNSIMITPLGRWQCDLPLGTGVDILNLSAPGNPVKSGEFGSQSPIARYSSIGARFLKDAPGG